MARVLGYFRVLTQMQMRDTAHDIMGFANRLLATEWSERTMVTAILCIFDNETGKLSLCSAGHPPPYRLRASCGELERVRMDRALPLGVEPAMRFESVEVEAAAGDTFVLYTDGVTEAKSRSGQMFSERRLEQIIRAHKGSPAVLTDRIIAAVKEFTGGAPRQDDQTLVVMKRT